MLLHTLSGGYVITLTANVDEHVVVNARATVGVIEN